MTDATVHGAAGPSPFTKDNILESVASITQKFEPINSICAHLNAFHVYASDPKRSVESNHYCTHLSADVRQCLIYDGLMKPAKLIGVEYMVTKSLYDTLDSEERKLWHSHDFEVKSGMLIMPNSNVPTAVWDKAEQAEMEEVVGLYGKTYHFWQVDRGDNIPLGEPQLMTSFTSDEQVPWDKIKDRDIRYEVDTAKKREQRQYIKSVDIHLDADQCWKQ